MTTYNLINSEKAAEILGIDAATLAVWRSTKRVQIPFIKVGGRVRYSMEDITSFINSNKTGEQNEKN